MKLSTVLKGALALLFPFSVAAQNQPFWSNNGNNVSGSDFFGSINNQPLIFRAYNVERMRLTPNGYLGIGITNPAYMLDVNGSAHFNGTITASGLIIQNKVVADTVRGGSMLDVNGTLGLTGGTYSEIFARTGDLRIQSNAAYSGNLIFGSGSSAKIGIGTSSPQYKLDVNGTMRVNGPLYVQRFKMLAGDSFVFGDSTIVFLPNLNNIHGGNGGTYKGLGLGLFAYPKGLASVAVGRSVQTGTNATNAIVIGSGASTVQPLQNNMPNSLVVGFNSTVPTFFVSSGSGVGTLGKVGIGTTNPGGLLQVGDGMEGISFGAAHYVAGDFTNSYIGFNASRDAQGNWLFNSDGTNNGGTVLLGDVGGGFRIVSIMSTQTSSSQTFSDQHVVKESTTFQVRGDGRVLIGGADLLPGSPYDLADTKLTVKGRILCTDLIVTNVGQWGDFVLDSTYSLMPMDSLSLFVHANHHLPGSKPASVQEANGVSLAETCRQQQIQIEELTLYILQMNQRLNALEAEKKSNSTAGGH